MTGRLVISAALVAATLLVVLFALDFVNPTDEPLAEDGGPYLDADEAPVMQEPSGSGG